MNRLLYLIVLSVFLLLITPTYALEEKVSEENQKEAAIETEKKQGNKIYAIKDRYGNIVGYTDNPDKGAEEIKILKGTEYKPLEADTTWTKVSPKVVEEPESYTNFAIVSPSNDATIRNNAGNIQIALDIRPTLQPGHKVQLVMDGVIISESRGVIHSANNVDRGTHAISAHILDAKNEIIKSSAPVTIHLHRASKK